MYCPGIIPGLFFCVSPLEEAIAMEYMTEIYFNKAAILIIRDGHYYKFDIDTPQYNALADIHDSVVAFMC